jgi:hypothetical protein
LIGRGIRSNASESLSSSSTHTRVNPLVFGSSGAPRWSCLPHTHRIPPVGRTQYHPSGSAFSQNGGFFLCGWSSAASFFKTSNQWTKMRDDATLEHPRLSVPLSSSASPLYPEPRKRRRLPAAEMRSKKPGRICAAAAGLAAKSPSTCPIAPVGGVGYRCTPHHHQLRKVFRQLQHAQVPTRCDCRSRGRYRSAMASSCGPKKRASSGSRPGVQRRHRPGPCYRP